MCFYRPLVVDLPSIHACVTMKTVGLLSAIGLGKLDAICCTQAAVVSKVTKYCCQGHLYLVLSNMKGTIIGMEVLLVTHNIKLFVPNP